MTAGVIGVYSDIQVHLPFGVDAQQLVKTLTFLDSQGRPTILLLKRFVVDEHAVPFQVCFSLIRSSLKQRH